MRSQTLDLSPRAFPPGGATVDGRPPPASRLSRLSPVGRLHSLALALLVAVVLAAACGMVRIERGDRWDHLLIAWSTCGMLVCLAICMLLLGRHRMQRSLKHVEDQFRTLSREDRLEPLPAAAPEELRAALAALAEYVDRVRTRMERLRVQRRELDLQMRTAQAERRHAEAILLSIADAVLVIDTFGELALANPAAGRLFGFSVNEARGRPIERVIQDPSLAALIREARDAGEAAGRREVEYGRLRDGRLATFTITLSPVVEETADGDARTADGGWKAPLSEAAPIGPPAAADPGAAGRRPCGVVAVFRDVTRERELARIKTDFVSAVAHELRTPLSSMKAYVEMLADGEAADEQTRLHFYRIIDSETDRLQRLISRVLDISRIESGVMDVRRARVHPRDVIREVLDMMAPQAREKGLALEAGLDEDLPAIEADRDLLYQAVQNVVGNAVKYTPAGGRVCVRTDIDPARGHFTITVSDTGIGIDQEDLPRIFDKFFRSREGAGRAQGAGLGLNLVKQIVETVHGGAIDVSSKRGAGATFVLRLPLDTVPDRRLLSPAGSRPRTADRPH